LVKILDELQTLKHQQAGEIFLFFLGSTGRYKTYICKLGLIKKKKKTEKILFSVYVYIQGNFKQTNFSCKTEKNPHRFFGADNWQEFCNFFH
jgi:hypothetical protein